MQRGSKNGFVLSALLHGAVVAVAVLVPILDLGDEEREKQFELVPLPPLTGEVGGGSDSGGSAERQFDFSGPDTPTPKKRAQPSPRPEAPTPKPPTPAKKPAPKAPTAKPTPAKQPAPAMSYDEFVKKHGAPKTPTRKPTAAGGGNSARPKGPRVDTDFAGTVRSSTPGGSRYGAVNGMDTSPRAFFIAELRGALEEAWPKPLGMADTLATTVQFSVGRDGRLAGVRITHASGDPAFDETVLAAFRIVTKVRPPPDGEALDSLELVFKCNEE